MMEQIERTRRYLNRLRSIYRGVPHTQDNREYYTDDVYSFFIHCYHIRDWIVQLNIVGVSEKDVDTFINAHKELRICADLCNGTKHCVLTRNMRTDRQPHLAGKSFTSIGMPDQICTIKGKFRILSGNEYHDALDIAESCMRLWDDFVASLKESANRRLGPADGPHT